MIWWRAAESRGDTVIRLRGEVEAAEQEFEMDGLSDVAGRRSRKQTACLFPQKQKDDHGVFLLPATGGLKALPCDRLVQ